MANWNRMLSNFKKIKRNMKHIQTFEEYVNESSINEAAIEIVYYSEVIDNWGRTESSTKTDVIAKLLQTPDDWSDDQKFEDKLGKPYDIDDLIGKTVKVGNKTFKVVESVINEWRKPEAEDLVHDMKVKITKGRYAGSTGIIHDFQLTDIGELVDNQIDVLVDKPGKPKSYIGLEDILIESIVVNESKKEKFLLYINPNNSTNRAYVAIGSAKVKDVMSSAKKYSGSYQILHQGSGTNDDLQKAIKMYSNYNFGDVKIDEGFLSKAASVPSNVMDFAKRKGSYATALVKKAATWAEKAGKRISGGTAIGKNYSTIILDMDHQGSEIYINLDDETIELFGEEVTDAKSFQKVLDNNSANESHLNENEKWVIWTQDPGQKKKKYGEYSKKDAFTALNNVGSRYYDNETEVGIMKSEDWKNEEKK
jgi:hypothetical protein